MPIDENCARLAEPAYFGGGAVSGSILFPDAARMDAVFKRKERILAYEEKLKDLLDDDYNKDVSSRKDLESGGRDGISTNRMEETASALKAKYLKPGDEACIIKCTCFHNAQ